MADNNEVLLKFGIDEGSFKKLIQDFSNQLQAGIKNSLKDASLGKELFKISPGQINTMAAELKSAVLQARLGDVVAKEMLIGAQDGAKSVSAIIHTAALESRLSDVVSREIIAGVQDGAKSISEIIRAGADSATRATQPTGPFSPLSKPPVGAEQIIINSQEINAAKQALTALNSELTQNGAKEKEVNQATQQLNTSLNSIANAYQKVQDAQEGRRVRGLDPSSTEAEVKQLSQLQIQLQRTTEGIQNFDKASVNSRTGTQKFTEGFKNMAFSIGLVGYGMENLGRRLLGFSESLFGMVKNVATTTEQFERLKNALIVEGDSKDERNSIVARIREISLLPGGKLQEVAKGFQLIREAGIGAVQSLDLLEGLTKATTRSGKGSAGVEEAIKILRRGVLGEEGGFKTQTVATLVSAVGPEIAAALKKAFGSVDAKTLNAAGGEKVIAIITEELKKLGDALPVTLDTINHIEDSLTLIGDTVLHILDPALVKISDLLLQVEVAAKALEDRFDALPKSTQNAISAIIAGSGLAVAALGTIMSVLGVVLVGIAVLGKSWKVVSGFFAETAPVIENTAGSLTTLGEAGAETGAVVEGVGTAFEGLTGPIGIAIAAITAYATNAGHARDTINSAFGSLWDSLKRAFDLINSFINNPAVSGFFSELSKTIKVVSDLIGGILGDVIGTLIKEVANIIDAVTSFFALLANPDVDKLETFGKALIAASVGWADTLGKLLASSFVEAVANLMPATPRTDASSIAGGAVKNLFTAGISGSGDMAKILGFNKEDLLGVASRMRAEVNKISVDSQATAGSFDEINKAAVETNRSLQETRSLLDGVDNSTQKLVSSFASVAANIQRANIKFADEQATKAAMAGFAIEGQEDPRRALADLPGVMAGNLKRDLADLRRSAADELSQIGTETVNTVSQMVNAFRSMDKISVEESLVAQFIKSAQALSAFASSGKVDPERLGILIKQYNTDLQTLDKNMGSRPQTAEGITQIKEFGTVVGNVDTAASKLVGVLGKYSESEADLTRRSKASTDEEERKLKERIKLLDVTVGLKDEYERIAVLQDAIKSDQDALARPAGFLTSDDRLVISQRLINEQKELQQLQDKIKNAAKGTTDAVTEAQTANVNAANTITTANERAAKSTEDWMNIVNQLTISFQTAYSELDKFKQSMSDFDAKRASLGLAPTVNRITTASIGAQATAEISPLLTQNKNLGSENIKGDLQLADNFLERVLDKLQRGEILTEGFTKSLSGVAIDSANALGDLQDKITRGQEQISATEVKLAKAPENAKAATRKELDELLKWQAQLTATGTIYANRLKAVNVINEANLKLVKEELRTRRLTLDADIAILEQRKIDLDLRQRDLELQLKSIESGGSNIPNMAAAREFLNLQLKNEIDLINEKYDAEINVIKAQQLEIEQQKLLHPEAAATAQAQIDLLQDRIDKLNELRQAEVDNAVAADNAFDKTLKALNLLHAAGQKAADSIMGLFNAIASGQFVVDDFADAIANGASLTKAFGDLAMTAMAGFGQAIGQAISAAIVDGEPFLKSLGHFFGAILINLGEMLIQLSVASLALAALAWFFPGIVPPQWALGVPAAIAAGVAGVALLAAGTLMGGGSGKTSKTASTNTSNSTNSATGATGPGFDASKNAQTLYQKEQNVKIYLDIRHDDGIIIKKVIKEVNRNGRLGNLIGNRKLADGGY